MSVKKKDSPLAAKSADRSPVAARDAAYRVLMMVEEQNAYANLALKKLFSQIKISAADKRLATHIVYGSVRQRFSLEYIINPLLSDPHAPLMTQARVILRLSIYQLYYLDRIEPYSVVDEAVKLAKRYANLPISRLVNAVLRNYLRRCEALGGKEKMLPDKSDIFG